MHAGLAARHPEVQALKAMLRDRAARAEAGMCVIEGQRALEGALDQLAAKCGLDRWEIRWRNAVDIGDVLTTGQPVEKISRDTERDNFFSADEAVSYGIIDKVLSTRGETAA